MSTAIETAAPTYRRGSPPEWAGLLAHAEAIQEPISSTPGLTAEGALSALELIDGLDNEALEANRYYAMGQVMCNVARNLADPEVRETTAKNAANELLDGLGLMVRGLPTRIGQAALCVADLPIGFQYPSLKRIVNVSYDQTAPPIRLLGDTLDVIASYRARSSRRSSLYRVSPDRDDDGMFHSKITRMQNDVLESRPIAMNVSLNMQAGATRIIKIALGARVLKQSIASGKHMTAFETEILDIIRDDEFAALQLTDVARKSALLHLADFNDRLDQYIAPNSNGELIFNTKLFRETISSKSTDKKDMLLNHNVLHETRLGCPAAYVDGLIGQIMSLMPQIFMNASRSLKSAHGINTAPSDQK